MKIKHRLLTVLFLLVILFLSLTLVLKTQNLLKKASHQPLEAIFDITPGQKINRIWNYFAQGGEEHGLMLRPAEKEIKSLEPKFIRIDHLFDFPSLDQRVDEITALGAIPFLSLSYFPSQISSDLTKMPPSLEAWKTLVEETVRRYSSPSGKNLAGIYYEVWNEPDLFGKMSSNEYFSLYQASVEAASRCSDCQPFKIGGPAITTLKTDWMNDFLSQVAENKTRLDFLSWHSYQQNPRKTLWEAQTIRSLANFRRLGYWPELIISEWGSLPEISPLHDSYFDASHTISSVALLRKTISKLFAFELKDGPSPEGKKYWGRWGMLTHQNHGLTPKPRYFAFLYLNKLLDKEIEPVIASSGLSVIGSTDGRENYVFISTQAHAPNLPTSLKIRRLPPGIYLTSTYTLGSNQSPLTPQVSQTAFNGGDFTLNYQLPQSGVIMTELSRLSPALVKVPGRSGDSIDYAAKTTSFVPPLVFTLHSTLEFQRGEIRFWFKPNWGQEAGPYGLWESKDGAGNGLAAWVEKEPQPQLIFALFKDNQPQGQIKVSLENWREPAWHQLAFRFDNPRMVISLLIDGKETIESFSAASQAALGDFLYLGSRLNQQQFAEGSLDDFVLTLDEEVIYEKNFD
jgi:hypothetical protein